METKQEINKFFRDVATNCNFIDEKNVQDVYYALIRTILKECKSGSGKITLPAFGEMELRERPSKRVKNVNTGVISINNPYKIIKFNMSKRLKDYLKGIR